MSEVKRYWATVGSCDPEMHRIDYVESPDGKMVMFHDYDALKAENERLAAALREARKALFIIACHPIKHDPQAYAVVPGIAETAIDDADAALSAVPSAPAQEDGK